jgi:hypothetical protein
MNLTPDIIRNQASTPDVQSFDTPRDGGIGRAFRFGKRVVGDSKIRVEVITR